MIKGVPYDAQIAFLESTGTQYINTGVPIYYTSTISLTFAATTDTASYFFGDSISVINGGGYYLRISRLANSTLNVQTDAGSTIGTPPSTTKGSFYTVSISNKKSYLDGVPFGTITATDTSITKTEPAYIFAWNRSPQLYGSVKISRCTITARDGTTPLRDYIPVRVGTTGYLYDRVTRRLFGNAGTGAFTLGPDVATPVMSLHRMALAITAKSYVQNGLVAMWDGIENAGWGTHSNNSPIDLIAGIQLTPNTSGTIISADSFMTPTGTYFYADIPDFKTAVNNKDFTCEIVMSGERASNNGIFSIGDRGLWVYGSSSYVVATVNIMATSYTQGITPNFSSDSRFSFAVAGGQSPAVYIGGQTKSASYGSLSSLNNNRIYIGGMNGNNVFSPASKTFYCVRLYNRTLSAQEIAANYAIDVARFKLPQGGAQ